MMNAVRQIAAPYVDGCAEKCDSRSTGPVTGVDTASSKAAKAEGS